MKRGGHCPVWGKISVEKDNSGICSAPIGAGGLFDVNPFYRAFAPDGAGDTMYAYSFYRASAPIGAGGFAIENQIDQLVYQLYELTPVEIEIIENSVK